MSKILLHFGTLPSGPASFFGKLLPLCSVLDPINRQIKQSFTKFSFILHACGEIFIPHALPESSGASGEWRHSKLNHSSILNIYKLSLSRLYRCMIFFA
jgi:hypothetical protein